MSKQQLKHRETSISTESGHTGRELEQTITVDDNNLPSPQELVEYKAVDPRIIDFLLDASVKEQGHRHEVDIAKLSIIKKAMVCRIWINRSYHFCCFYLCKRRKEIEE
jgi:uncharacterized membrane protein